MGWYDTSDGPAIGHGTSPRRSTDGPAIGHCTGSDGPAIGHGCNPKDYHPSSKKTNPNKTDSKPQIYVNPNLTPNYQKPNKKSGIISHLKPWTPITGFLGSLVLAVVVPTLICMPGIKRQRTQKAYTNNLINKCINKASGNDSVLDFREGVELARQLGYEGQISLGERIKLKSSGNGTHAHMFMGGKMVNGCSTSQDKLENYLNRI